MEITLYNQNGEAVAYITDDYNQTIYLLDGHSVAYLYEDMHIYGINGHHLGWFVDDIVFDNKGERVGFTRYTCPKLPGKEPVKAERYSRDEIRPRWAAPPYPQLIFDFWVRDFEAFLKGGQTIGFNGEKS